MLKARQTYRQAVAMYGEPSQKSSDLELDELMIEVDRLTEKTFGRKRSDEDWMKFYETQTSGLVKRFEERRDIDKALRKYNTEDFQWYFITIGYDDDSINVDLIRKYSIKVATSSFFEEAEYVNEKFRKNDAGDIYIHHHTHFLVKCELPKSRVIDRVFSTVKQVVKGKNFIDVKSAKDRCGSYNDKLKYIRGDKTEKKMECVLLDREWRITNNL